MYLTHNVCALGGIGLPSSALIMQAAARMVACNRHVVPSSYHNMPGPPLFMALQVHGYFEGIGYELPEKANPADFYMDIVAGVVPNKARQHQTPQARLLLLVPFPQSLSC